MRIRFFFFFFLVSVLIASSDKVQPLGLDIAEDAEFTDDVMTL